MKGEVCVTGGRGYLASWLVMRLLQRGYSVRTTVRSYSGGKKDVSYLTNLPGASDRLRIFDADLAEPQSFKEAIEGCVGVFHVAHPIDLEGKEPEEVVSERAIKGALGIMQVCLDSKTVRRVVYTSSAATLQFNDRPDDEKLDENSWSDIDYIKALNPFGAPYLISKIKTEKAAIEFAKNHGLDLVTVVPTFIVGAFLGPHIPGSVFVILAMVLGNKHQYGDLMNTCMVHIDDVVNAHMFLLENPDAKGRFICSSQEVTLLRMSQFLSAKYPEFPTIPTPDAVRDIKGYKIKGVTSKKLLDHGFEFKYGLDEMYDAAIQCCKEKGLL